MAADISRIIEIDGFIAGCLVDADTGLMLTSQGGGGADLEIVCQSNARVLAATVEANQAQGITEPVEDVIISTGAHVQIIRPLSKGEGLFLFVAVDLSKTKLGVARLQVAAIEAELEF